MAEDSMTIAVTSPVWANADHTMINCEVQFFDGGIFLPFTATAFDAEEHGKQIWADLNAGLYGEISIYNVTE